MEKFLREIKDKLEALDFAIEAEDFETAKKLLEEIYVEAKRLEKALKEKPKKQNAS